ncbi:hypothetical protein HLH34_15045 [Gluconacetobacter azotocaptans]|uniref:Uncharacterized protein n=1 Tax=Gluconacetobacter azotocaptans TaxID=142834 RepID=A0A7W4PEE3_9PROT|nr:hypothetical protein [Gluconacetobacter azotocaptans]MBB2191262.1 hypothetical protein [Gluconacetobacter azotocaptans]GBQ25746.1 hypothetical protein AA13594_0009 [Gluconacetobacter azotocaptans DSM 13594]
MPTSLEISSSQLDAIISSLNQIAKHSNGWDWHTGIPTAIGALLGFGAAQLQDCLRTRRDKRKEDRKRREDELAQIGATFVALTFNLESAIHTVMQQVLPHYMASRGALDIFESAAKQSNLQSELHKNIQKFLPDAFRRVPEPHLVAIDAFSDLSFLLNKHADLVKGCGWIESFARDLRIILRERNKLIDAATVPATKKGRSLEELHIDIKTQTSISRVEIGNSFQFLEVSVQMIDKVIAIQKSDYKSVVGSKLGIIYPPVLSDVRKNLKAALQVEGIWREMEASYPD